MVQPTPPPQSDKTTTGLRRRRGGGDSHAQEESQEQQQQQQEQQQHLQGGAQEKLSTTSTSILSSQQQQQQQTQTQPSTLPPTQTPTPTPPRLFFEIPKSFLDLQYAGQCAAHSAADDEIDQVGILFRNGAIMGLSLWVVLMLTVFLLAPADSYEEPMGLERTAHLITFCVLFITNGSRLLPLALRNLYHDENDNHNDDNDTSDNNGNITQSRATTSTGGGFVGQGWKTILQSGVLRGTLSVQCIAMASNLIMAFYPTPVIVDRVTGVRVHLFRWVEWTPLAFLMTFLTDNIDVPVKRHLEKQKQKLRQQLQKQQQNDSANAKATNTATATATAGVKDSNMSTNDAALQQQPRRTTSSQTTRSSTSASASSNTSASSRSRRKGSTSTSTSKSWWLFYTEHDFGTAMMISASAACGGILPFCTNWTTWLFVFNVSWLLFCPIYVLLYRRARQYWSYVRQRHPKNTTTTTTTAAAADAAQSQQPQQGGSGGGPEDMAGSGKFVFTPPSTSTSTTLPSAAGEAEHFELVRASYILSVACSATWTLLSVMYSVVCLAPAYSQPGSLWANPALPTLSTCFWDVSSKVWYLSALIDAYDKVFDESTRAVRRLEELRAFMSAVWESSSDVIVFCGKNNEDGHVSVRISPAFLKMIGLSSGKRSDHHPNHKNNNSSSSILPTPLHFLNRADISIVMEVYPEEDMYYVFAMDLSKPITRDDAARYRSSLKAVKYRLTADTSPVALSTISTEERNLAVMARLAVTACDTDSMDMMRPFANRLEVSIMQDLFALDPLTDQVTPMRCEAKIAKLEGDHHSVIVLRDISERLQRFEAEKQLLREVTIRKKDAEANRFTRHEVKNGILAAMGLVDHLRESLERTSAAMTPRNSVAHDHVAAIESALQDIARVGRIEEGDGEAGQPSLLPSLLTPPSPEELYEADIQNSVMELESTLRDILDTILDEAMAREIIYGEYVPKKEKIAVVEVLASLRRRTSKRFTLKIDPDPFPLLELDRQLLRYIYRNAVSNACRHGKMNGTVDTVIRYDRKERIFSMEVINLPGERHAELIQLDNDVVASIFSPGTQLRATSLTNAMEGTRPAGLTVTAPGPIACADDGANDDPVLHTDSGGNGAWIMQKCAEVLGGKCTIRFEEKATTFTFTYPVQSSSDTTSTKDGSWDDENDEPFRIPETTWGVAIDDSAIQRKLMDRLLKMVGIEKSRRLILGQSASEVFGFTETIAKLLQDNPNDKVLIIADENLDIVDGGAKHETVSGSGLVAKLRQELDEATERRLLALIRSANDSGKDLELYEKRAHGYLLKQPLKSQNVLEFIKPLWLARFVPTRAAKEERRGYATSEGQEGVIPNEQGGTERSEDDDECYCPTGDELRESIQGIEALCSGSNENNNEHGDAVVLLLNQRWRVIREKLHALKGDLKTLKTKESLRDVEGRIDKLLNNNNNNNNTLPESFVTEWSLLRSQLEALLA